MAELHILAKTDIVAPKTARQEGQLRAGGKRIKLDGDHRLPTSRRAGRAGSDRPAKCTEKLLSGESRTRARRRGSRSTSSPGSDRLRGLHLVPIPFTKTFADHDTVGEFETGLPVAYCGRTKGRHHRGAGSLAVFNWPNGSDRYRRIERFVERLFSKWQPVPDRPPPSEVARRQPWRARFRAGNRHTIAEQMLARFHGPSTSAQGDISSDLQAFLNRAGTGRRKAKPNARSSFRQFMQWREQQGRATAMTSPSRLHDRIGSAMFQPGTMSLQANDSLIVTDGPPSE